MQSKFIPAIAASALLALTIAVDANAAVRLAPVTDSGYAASAGLVVGVRHDAPSCRVALSYTVEAPALSAVWAPAIRRSVVNACAIRFEDGSAMTRLRLSVPGLSVLTTGRYTLVVRSVSRDRAGLVLSTVRRSFWHTCPCDAVRATVAAGAVRIA